MHCDPGRDRRYVVYTYVIIATRSVSSAAKLYYIIIYYIYLKIDSLSIV